jgi:hypothetical protein
MIRISAYFPEVLSSITGQDTGNSDLFIFLNSSRERWNDNLENAMGASFHTLPSPSLTIFLQFDAVQLMNISAERC